jgi:hypothetical protein
VKSIHAAAREIPKKDGPRSAKALPESVFTCLISGKIRLTELAKCGTVWLNRIDGERCWILMDGVELLVELCQLNALLKT